jgi:hypothetical protein
LLGETDVAGAAGASGVSFSVLELSLLAEQLANTLIINRAKNIFFICFDLVITVNVIMNFLFLWLRSQLYVILFKIAQYYFFSTVLIVFNNVSFD